MSAPADTVEYDESLDVYRIRTSAGVWLGTEYGGYPLGYDTRPEAEEHVELRVERAAERAEFLGEREQLGFRP